MRYLGREQIDRDEVDVVEIAPADTRGITWRYFISTDQIVRRVVASAQGTEGQPMTRWAQLDNPRINHHIRRRDLSVEAVRQDARAWRSRRRSLRRAPSEMRRRWLAEWTLVATMTIGWATAARGQTRIRRAGHTAERGVCRRVGRRSNGQYTGGPRIWHRHKGMAQLRNRRDGLLPSRCQPWDRSSVPLRTAQIAIARRRRARELDAGRWRDSLATATVRHAGCWRRHRRDPSCRHGRRVRSPLHAPSILPAATADICSKAVSD